MKQIPCQWFDGSQCSGTAQQMGEVQYTGKTHGGVNDGRETRTYKCTKCNRRFVAVTRYKRVPKTRRVLEVTT